MSNQAPDWVVPVMRTGYAARALTYAIVGGLAVWAAWTGGAAQGTSDALKTLRSAPLGQFALWGVAIGLAAYGVWRIIDGILDLDAHGHDLKGVIARSGQVVTGLIYGAVAFSVLRTATRNDSGGDGTQSAVSQLMQLPFGPMLVMLAGAATLGAAGHYVHKAVTRKYHKRMSRTDFTTRLDPLLMAGLIANGIVVGLIGAFIIYAGYMGNAGAAGGVGQAFETVRAAPFGRVMLFILAFGTMLFGFYCIVMAVYRVIPRHSGEDVMTMAGDLRDQVRDTLG